MAGIFFLFILMWFFAYFRWGKVTLVLGFMNLVFAILTLLYHATDKLNIRL